MSAINHSITVTPAFNEPLFDRYEVKSEGELNKLQGQGLLKGAFVITGDHKHVGIHKLFYIAQKIRLFFARLFGCSKEKAAKLDISLCHGAVVVGWDDKKIRPLFAHSVIDGVKVNATNYFTYADKDVDHMAVFVPRDEKLRNEFLKNAHQAAEISKSQKRIKFAWGHLFSCFFKKQEHTNPTKAMKKSLAYMVTDLLLKNPMLEVNNPNKARSMFCMEFALNMLQASVLTKTLSQKDVEALVIDESKSDKHVAYKSRDEIAKEIFNRISKKQDADALSKAYWETHFCKELNPSATMSCYGARTLDEVSVFKPIE